MVIRPRPTGTGSGKFLPKLSYPTTPPLPTPNGGMAYSTTHSIIAVDANGQPLLSYPGQSDNSPMAAGYDGTIYVYLDSNPSVQLNQEQPHPAQYPTYLVALDGQTGKERFKISMPMNRSTVSGPNAFGLYSVQDKDSGAKATGPMVMADGSVNLALYVAHDTETAQPNTYQGIPDNLQDKGGTCGSSYSSDCYYRCPLSVTECWAAFSNQTVSDHAKEIDFVHVQADGAFTISPIAQDENIYTQAGYHYTYTQAANNNPLGGVCIYRFDDTVCYVEHRENWYVSGSPRFLTGANGKDLTLVPNGAGGVLLASGTNQGDGSLSNVWVKNIAQPSSSAAGAEYALPIDSIHNLVIGENGNAFAAGGLSTDPEARLVSFNLSSGAANWIYRSSFGGDYSSYVDTVAAGPNNSLYATEGLFQEARVAFTLDANGVRTDNPSPAQALTYITSAGIGSDTWMGANLTQTASLGSIDLPFGMPMLLQAGGAPPNLGIAAVKTTTPVAINSRFQNRDPSGSESLGAIYRETVAELAKASVGDSSTWKEGFPNPPVTCNIFVKDILNSASDQTVLNVPAPTRPPRKRFFITRIDAFLAADWANPSSKAGCWKVIPGGSDAAQPGDILATGYPPNGPDGTGHVGIVVVPDASSPLYKLASAADVAPYFWTAAQKLTFIPGTITLTDYGFRLPGFNPKDPNNNQGLKKDSTVRRFSCH